MGVTTRFRVAEFGMEDFEPLAWATATAIPASPNFPKRFHVVANGHVVTPWRYLKLYPENEWLQHVRQEHCRYSVAESEVVATPFAHETRDLACVYLEDETVVEHAVELSTRPLEEGLLEVCGYTLENDALSPLKVEAAFRARTPAQTFLATAKPLPQGMCGAPALFQADYACAGIVDGIVPEGDTDDELRRMVAGAASIVTADELRAFLHRAENDASLVAVLEQSLA